MDLSDALHPTDGTDPAQPALILGAPSTDQATGSPPFLMRCLDIPSWLAYIAAFVFTWRTPSRVVLHHTWRPAVADWRGLDSMRAMQRHYAGLGWTSAPHLYAAPDGIWLATDLSRIGIHAGAGNGSVADGWYSIGVEMVGDYDRERPGGPVWANTVAVLQGLSGRIGRPLASVLSFHRDYSTKSCPGHAVTRDWVLAETASAPSSAPFTPDSPILGPTPDPLRLADAVFVRCAQSPYAREREDPIRRAIVARYLSLCAQTGVNAWVALAQLTHETGGLTSALSQRRDKDGRDLRNPAGIGVTGESSPAPRRGYVWDADHGTYRACVGFPSWDVSVLAHVGRLLAYAVPPAARTPAQRALVAGALEFRPLPSSHHGSAPTLRGLGGRWAAGQDYGAALARAANALWRAA